MWNVDCKMLRQLSGLTFTFCLHFLTVWCLARFKKPMVGTTTEMGFLRICFAISVCSCVTALSTTFNWHLEQSEEKSLGEAQNVKEQELLEKISYIYYKRLVNQLLDQSKMTYNEHADMYTRHILVSINAKDLEMASSSTDPRDWEAILSTAFHNKVEMAPPKCSSSPGSTISTMKYLLMSTIESSEVKFLGVFILILAGVIYINKRTNYSYVTILITIVFFTGFIYTYLDCNRKLLIERMVELENVQDYCGKEDSKGWSFFGFFSESTQNAQCIEQLKRKHSLKLSFCRPDEVFLMFINETILNQFKLIIEKCTDILRICLEKFRFPYNIVAIGLFGFTFSNYLGLVFKYIISPQVWIQLFTASPRNGINEQRGETHDRTAVEIVQLFLNHLRGDSVNNVQQIEISTHSGVEILEASASKKPSTSASELNKSNDEENNSKNDEKISKEETNKKGKIEQYSTEVESLESCVGPSESTTKLLECNDKS